MLVVPNGLASLFRTTQVMQCKVMFKFKFLFSKECPKKRIKQIDQSSGNSNYNFAQKELLWKKYYIINLRYPSYDWITITIETKNTYLFIYLAVYW